jgi:hypothetical protein
VTGTSVVLLGLHGIIGEIVRAALHERDVDIVGDLDDESELEFTLARVDADCVIWRNGRRDPAAADLLARHPRLRIIALEDDGKRAFLYELRPRRMPLGELSPGLLARVVEAAGR